jgi:uncharacterized protein involved in exopolysaccharide biosynthesis
VAIRYAVLLREVKTQDALLDILTQQYYEAKLQESKDVSTVSVLDRAIPPIYKMAPKRTLTVLAATMLGGLVGIAWALFSGDLSRVKEDLLRS